MEGLTREPAPVVACTWREPQGNSSDEIEDLLAMTRGLARSLGAAARWLVLGGVSNRMLDVAARFGITVIDRAEDTRFTDFQPDLFVEALTQYFRLASPRALLLSQDDDARLLAARLAARVDAAVVVNVVDVEGPDAGTIEAAVSAHGGDTRAVLELAEGRPGILVTIPGSWPLEPDGGDERGPVECREINLDLVNVQERIRVVHREVAENSRLEEARLVVSGGRGLGSREGYALVERLAEALDGLPAATRAVVDQGWADRSRQVGLTGKVTRPDLYLAIAISGASQHMAGCTRAKTIVAINRDPDAAIFRYARFGVVGDALAILPELLRLVTRQA